MTVCRCGCGNETAPRRKYFADHYSGSNHPLWKGGMSLTKKGYRIYRHSRFAKGVFEHVMIAEKALGRSLPKGVEVHHVNENRADNTPGNLVLCQDHAYHMLLQRRTRALNACGNADWLKCKICKQYDDPKNLRQYNDGSPNRVRAMHRACVAKQSAKRKAA